MGLEQALAFTLKEEGGFVDDPKDHGGATCRGVTQRTYDTYRDRMRLPRRTVAEIDPDESRDIYTSMYWNPGHCRELPARLGVCHFDWCVNHGVIGALRMLQQVLGTAASPKDDETWKTYNKLRRDWYRARVKSYPDQGVFLSGWLARVDRLDAYIEGLAR